MATQPSPESPVPDSQPASPGAPPPEIAPIAPDIDQPSPGTMPGDPGTSQPAQLRSEDLPMPDTDMENARRLRDEKDSRSDLEQAVEARSDAVERGEGGPEPETMTDPGLADGVGGTGGVVRNQDDDAQ